MQSKKYQNSSFRNFIKYFIKIVLVLISTALFVVILRLFCFEIYKIPSISMYPTLISGDHILVSKMNYGPRVVKLRKLIKERKIEYNWHRFARPHKGDIFVFNFPNYKSLYEDNNDFYGSCIVKRCFGETGDTILVRNVRLSANRPGNKEFYDRSIGVYESCYLFPHDCDLNWIVDNYGPLWVPGKGETAKI